MHVFAERVDNIGLDGLDRTVSGGIGKAAVDMQATIVEVIHVLGVELFRFLIGFGYTNSLGKCATVWRFILAAFGNLIPIAIQ